MTAFTLQAASFCVRVKRLRLLKEFKKCLEVEGGTANTKHISFILPFTSCHHHFLTLPAQVYRLGEHVESRAHTCIYKHTLTNPHTLKYTLLLASWPLVGS